MANKVLLLQDVEKLGRKGDIASARPGYIRNYLVPQGFAVIPTRQTLRQQTKLQEERRQQAIEDKRDAEAAATHLIDKVLKVFVKVDPDGKMYGSVSILDIVHMLKEQVNLEIDRRSIQLKQPIKEIGVHTIAMKFKEGIGAEIKLKVMAEGTVEEQEAPVEQQQ